MTRKELILDKNIKIIYNKLENLKLNQGYIDLSNSSIQNKNDLVDAVSYTHLTLPTNREV